MASMRCVNEVERAVVYSPIGLIEIVSCHSGLHTINQIGEQIIPNTNIKVELKDKNIQSELKPINDSIKWLVSYFETPNKHMNTTSPKFCPFEKHSDFNRKVWSTLTDEVRFGHKITYSELAFKSIGNAKASRAVGTAMKNNPFQLIVPCHRVIKKDGTTGNYAGGNKNDLKGWLLSYESNFSSDSNF